MINLTGTGGIGKSWFCRGLESFIKQDCLYIPLQYQARVTINDLLNYLEKYCKNEKKNWIFSKDSISLKDFKNFLPNLLTELKKNVLRKKLVLLLDGLDELPEDSDVLTYLECSPYEIPEGCYILIASRPDLKPKAEILLKNMLAGISNAMRLEMKPEDMEDALQTYIRNQNFPSEWTQAILTKSEKIFLYVFHYCHLLNKKMFDGPNLPDKKDLYTTFFDHLKKCTGEELFRSCYVPLLTVLAVAKEPVSLDQLGSWGIRKDNAEMAIFDIAHFLERETSGKEITYTIRHNDLRDFFQEDKTWRNECQEQEENILRWAKTILEKFVASQELDSEEHYTLEHAIIHWNTVAGKDLQKANEPDIIALAVVSSAGVERPERPCGICREFIHEHAQRLGHDILICMANLDGTLCEFGYIADLLPHCWTPAQHSELPALPWHCWPFQTDKHQLYFGDMVQTQGRFLSIVWEAEWTPSTALVKLKYDGKKKFDEGKKRF